LEEFEGLGSRVSTPVMCCSLSRDAARAHGQETTQKKAFYFVHEGSSGSLF
jgi:hypothetical protein